MATLVPTEATDVLVVDLIEARTRLLMAKRAALPNAYPHRGTRSELKAEINASLERWNWLVLGR